MPRFFVDRKDLSVGDILTIDGENARHISFSLRMSPGEIVTVCDCTHEYTCRLDSFDKGVSVTSTVIAVKDIETEPPYLVTLYQGLTKGDKLDHIIQKSVECGVTEIVPFISSRCIAKETADDSERKTARRQKIAEEAAKQSGRGKIPKVIPSRSFKACLSDVAEYDVALFCYEGEGCESIKTALSSVSETVRARGVKIALFVGSEGGFSKDEAECAERAGCRLVNLGKRILRAETAPIFVLSSLVYEFEL